VKRFRALLFDVDGVIAETEEVHRRAFNESFAYFDLPWIWDVELYRKLLQVAGGKERIRHFLGSRPGSERELSHNEIDELHRLKTQFYARMINAGDCELRPGIADLIKQALDWKQRLGIVTTTSRYNVNALLEVTLGRSWTSCFDVIVCGEDVEHKKPAPDAYLKAVRLLDLPPRSCLAIEDSRNGLVAACSAGVPALMTRSRYFHHEEFDEAIGVVDDLTILKNFNLGLPT
jgi:HAD superfamily hydrolase (TIGR01509 family)